MKMCLQSVLPLNGIHFAVTFVVSHYISKDCGQW